MADSTGGYDGGGQRTINISYNSSTIAHTNSSAVTLKTAGKYMESDVNISLNATSAFPPAINLDSSTGVITGTNTFSSGYYLSGIISSTLSLPTMTASTWMPGVTSQTISQGQYLVGAQTIAGDSNLIASNIVSGVSIFGVNGTYQGGAQSASYYMQDYKPVSAPFPTAYSLLASSTMANFYRNVSSGSYVAWYRDYSNYISDGFNIEVGKTYDIAFLAIDSTFSNNTKGTYFHKQIYMSSDIVKTGIAWDGADKPVYISTTKSDGIAYWLRFEDNSILGSSVTVSYSYVLNPIIREVTSSVSFINKISTPVINEDDFLQRTISNGFNTNPRYTYENNRIAWIGPYAFAGYVYGYGVSSMSYIFNAVVSIGHYGMSGLQCNNLNIPNLVSIYSHAFESARVSGTFNIGSNVRAISESAFAYFSNSTFKNISFPKVQYIHSGTFMYTSINTANFESATGIGMSAFSYCRSLTAFNAPNASTINPYAFYYCDKLSSFSVDFSRLSTIGSSAFQYCTLLQSFSAPNVGSIGQRAFFSCKSLSFVSFDNLSRLDAEIFYGCSALKNVYMPNVSAFVGSSQFKYCSELEYASFNNLSSIGAEAFLECTNLSYVYIPNVKTISQSAFAKCSSLRNVYMPLLSNLYNGAYAFRNCGLTVLKLPNLTSMTGYAVFESNADLSCVYLGKSFYLSGSAFSNCVRLTSLYLLASSYIALNSAASSVFYSTPIYNYSDVAGQFGSIYVPSSMFASYKTRQNWVTLSSRFVSLNDTELQNAIDEMNRWELE